MNPRDLVVSWRADAVTLERHGAKEAAATARLHAEQLEAALAAAADRLLAPAEASVTSGYSTRRLRELEAEGKLVNRGSKGAPRYRAGDLPRKPRADAGVGGFDPAAEARSILSRGGR